MKKVDVIRPSSLNSIIGPSGTLRRIIKNKDFFENRGYCFEIFTYDNLLPEKKVSKLDGKKQSIIKNFLSKIKSRLRMKAKDNKILAIAYLKRNNKKINSLISYYLSLSRDPDIVVFHSVIECYYYLKRSRRKKSKIVLFYHSDGIPMNMLLSYYPVLKNTSFFNKLLEMDKYVTDNVSKCVFISRNGQQNFLKYYPEIDIKQTTVILNGIDDLTEEEKFSSISTPTYEVDKYKYRLCCVGTINLRKGHRIILEALSKTRKEILNQMHVTFIGEGPERVFLEQFVLENNLADNVQFLGMIDNRDIYRYLKQENIYILMSKNEGLPISIIEAMRAGLPIISTYVAGIPELVNEGQNGLLLDPDVDQLVKVFNNINSYDWTKMGERSRSRFLNEFTFNRMKKEYCDMLDKL